MLTRWSWEALTVTWVWRPSWIAVAAALAASYGVGLWRCRRAGLHAVRAANIVAFFVGLTLLVFTVSSAIDVYAMALLWMHMIEHLLLIMVVPALLVLGRPLTLLTTWLRAHRTERVLSSWPVSVLVHPLVGFAVYTLVIVGTHLTHFMDQMAMSTWLMNAEQVLYVVAGYIFLLPLVGNEPIRWQVPHLVRLPLILVGMAPDTIVGIVLMQSTDPFPRMLAMRPSWALPAARDVLTAGGIMWAGGDGLMMLIAVATIAAIMRTGARGSVLGGWLDNARRATLARELGDQHESDQAALAADVDVDEDDAVLKAYNQMLSKLSRRQ